MIGRLIDAFYWMGRYVERAENTTRIVDVNYHASLKFEDEANFDPSDEDGPFSLTPWAPIQPESMVRALILDEENPSSVPSCLSNAHLNAQKTRNKMDVESWEVINRAYMEGGDPPSEMLEEERLNEYCSRVLQTLHEFTGTIQSNMFRGEGWLYLRAGRFLERADNCLRQLKVYRSEVDQSAPGMQVRTKNRLFLKSIGVTMLLKDRGTQYEENPESILDFLLSSDHSPRSLKYSLDQLHRSLMKLQDDFYTGRKLPIKELTALREKIDTVPTKNQETVFFQSFLERLAELSNRLVHAFKKGSAGESTTERSLQSQQ